ncbi:putative heterokaryon incompatibility protein [Botrytis fragariae]|uniref:Putative heterokaryon incompatibility protein n=1 Tax=Botrytis fragariae TaxID=1964551 RepID=A0A8H6ELL3_9HELO|nr:putative heterokaryon incompatibility protein [Botrytis fragariae]KAF5876420.1 putative heterokaryon incompatibility protein [Botrytis fragariae]
MLCKLCDSLNVTDLLKLAKANSDQEFGYVDYLYFEHHKRYDDLVTAASSGCELCLLLQRQCEEEEINKSELNKLLTWDKMSRIMEAENRSFNLRVEIGCSALYHGQQYEEFKLLNHLIFTYWQENGSGDYNSIMVCSLQTPKDQPKFIDDIRIGQFTIDEDLASDANFDIARGWVNTCIVEHSKSKCPSFEDKLLPSRVINVGLENTNPSLVLTDGVRGKYVALSHCWGGHIETILTTSNLQSLQREIKMTSLPPNFRDAILITRALGFQFLWIDSLCIIQDSKYDWGIESKKMGEIYQNSVLTIGAAAAHKAADGMLHPRSQTSRDIKPKLKLSKDSGSDDVVEISSSILWPENLRKLFESGPLRSRAWALQERILSPRILWYGRTQIYWQCLCGFQSANGMPSGSSDFPRGELYIYPVITQRLIFNQNCNDGSKEFSEEELLEMNHEYQSIVMDYSTRFLSCPDDKLPAFSGIAALLHKGIGGHYLVGIWSKNFRENLLWYTFLTKRLYKKQYRAPSWSWAVTDEGSLVFYNNSSRLASTPHDPILLSHHIELSSENPYGAVKYAHIIVDTLTLKLIHLGKYKNPSNKTGFFLTSTWYGDTGLTYFTPPTSLEEEGEITTPSEGSVASTAIETSFRDAKLRASHSYSWDEDTPDWSAVSPFKYKVMLVGLERQSEKCGAGTSVLESKSCLKCLILQEDPEDAKRDRKARFGCMAGFRSVGKRDPKVDLNRNLTEEGMWSSISSAEFWNNLVPVW